MPPPRPLARLATVALHGLGLAALLAAHGAAALPRGSTAPPRASTAPAVSRTDLRTRITATYDQLPLSFEANAGQVDPAVRFLCRAQNYTLLLTGAETIISPRVSPRGQGPRSTLVRLRLAGGNADPSLAGEQPLAATTNYFLGKDPRSWHTAIANYSRVRAAAVYPGVDVVYRTAGKRVELDFIVAPGADPSRIRLAYRGADSITLDTRANLVLRTAEGDLALEPPVAYQGGGARRRAVPARYRLLGAEAHPEVGFTVGPYDRARPLVVDPVIAYATFLGGNVQDGGSAVALDGMGNLYVAGSTASLTFPGVGSGSIQPTNGGDSDAFVTKINAAGTAIVYSTFLGGESIDYARGLAVDGAGNAYVVGETMSTTFPGVGAGSFQPANAGATDAFLTKINAAGSAIVYSTFLGGSSADAALAVAVDAAGNAYLTGRTYSPTFPGVTASSLQPANAGFGDVFVTKINAAGSATVYSTFLGGSGTDTGYGIAVDAAGNAYVTGGTTSTTFPGAAASRIQPVNAGGSDAFVAKLDPAGKTLLYSTFLGGSGDDQAYAIALDGSGNAAIAGVSSSPTITGASTSPIQPAGAGGNDGFVAKLDPTGTTLIYSTLLGGPGDDYAFGIAVDRAGNAYVTGITSSLTFPGVNASSLQPANAGQYDAFFTVINGTGTAILSSTFLGGSEDDAGTAIVVDGSGNAYLVGSTASPTFPGVNSSSIEPVVTFDDHAFVAKIGAAAVVVPTLAPWGVIGFALLLAASGLTGPLRRRHRPPAPPPP